jgi:TonB family protein
MITGFNTDVEYDGRTFHVQTEERGSGNPVVETLVYCGGELVTFVTSSYADLVESTGCSESDVLGRMEGQHEQLIRQILGGKYHPAPKPYGHDLVSNRSLDEVVREYLDDSKILLDEVQQFLDEHDVEEVEEEEDEEAEEREGVEEGSLAASRARKLRRILARLESRMEEVRPDAPPSVSAPAPESAHSDDPVTPEPDRSADYEEEKPDESPATASPEAVPAAVAEAPSPRPRVALVLRARSRIWVATALVCALAVATLVLLTTRRTASPSPAPPIRTDAPAFSSEPLAFPAWPMTEAEPNASIGEAAEWPFLTSAEPLTPGEAPTVGERSERIEEASVNANDTASSTAKSSPTREPSSPRPAAVKQPAVEPATATTVDTRSEPAERRTTSPKPSTLKERPDPPVPAAENPVRAPRPEPEPAAVEQPPRDEDASLSTAPPVDPTPQESVPATPSVWTGKLVDYAEVDIPPRPVKRDLPSYTRRARRQQRAGTVEIAVMIIENGKVAHAKLAQGLSDSDLNQAAIDAARGWEYEPARKDGFAVRVWKTVRIHFSLAPNKKAIVKIED